MVGNFFSYKSRTPPFRELSLNIVHIKLLLIADSQSFHGVLPILDLVWFGAQYIFINLETEVDPQSIPPTPIPRSQVDL